MPANKITTETFPILNDVLSSVDMNFDSFEELIINKYGEHGVDYFVRRMNEALEQSDDAFYSDFEAILFELESDEKSEAIIKHVKKLQFEAKDEVLQRFRKIPEEIQELEEDLKTIYDSEEIRLINNQIHFLNQELEDKRAILGKRQDNYYEFMEALQSARAGEKIDSEPYINNIESVCNDWTQVDLNDIDNASSFEVTLYFKRKGEIIDSKSVAEKICSFEKKEDAVKFFTVAKKSLKSIENKIKDKSFGEMVSPRISVDDVVEKNQKELNTLFEQGIESQKKISKKKSSTKKQKRTTPTA